MNRPRSYFVVSLTFTCCAKWPAGLHAKWTQNMQIWIWRLTELWHFWHFNKPPDLHLWNQIASVVLSIQTMYSFPHVWPYLAWAEDELKSALCNLWYGSVPWLDLYAVKWVQEAILKSVVRSLQILTLFFEFGRMPSLWTSVECWDVRIVKVFGLFYQRIKAFRSFRVPTGVWKFPILEKFNNFKLSFFLHPDDRITVIRVSNIFNFISN